MYYVWPHQLQSNRTPTVWELRARAEARMSAMSVRLDAGLNRLREAIRDIEAAATRAQARNLAWTTFRWLMGFPIDDTPYRIPGICQMHPRCHTFRRDWPRRTTARRRVLWIYA